MPALSKLVGRYDALTVLLGRGESLVLLLIRLSVGLVFAWSGWGKLHHLSGVVEYFTELGIPYPELQAPFAAGTELVCGVALVGGLFTRLASVPLVVIMIVALCTAKRSDIAGLNDLFGLSEYLYIVLLLVLVVRGAGFLSLDRLLVRLRPTAKPKSV